MKSLVSVLLTLSAGFYGSGCGDPGPGDDTGALGEIVTLRGTIRNWFKGVDATVLATITTATTETGLTQPLAMGPIATNGAFSIELPQGEALAPYLLKYAPGRTPFPCTSIPAVDPPNYASSVLRLTAMKPTLPVLSLALTSNTSEYSTSFSHREIEFRYCDRDVTITGELHCKKSSTELIVHYDYHLQKGWNTLIVDYGELSGGPTEFSLVTIAYTKASPDDVQWMKSE